MRTLGLMFCLVIPQSGRAQSVPPAPVPATLAGSFFALSVADLAASTRWYTEKLGLRVVMQVPRQNRVAVTVLEGGGLVVELMQHEDAKPPGDPLLVHGVYKVGLVVENYPRVLDGLKARQVEIVYGPYPARAGQRANFVVKDNAGNLIQFFEK